MIVMSIFDVICCVFKIFVVGVGLVGFLLVYVCFICGLVGLVFFYDIVKDKVEVEVVDFVYGIQFIFVLVMGGVDVYDIVDFDVVFIIVGVR